MKIEFQNSITRLSFSCRITDIKIAWINPWCLLGHFQGRSSRPEVFCKKGVLKNFAKTGKHLCLFFNKIAGLSCVTLLKKRL